MTDSRKRSGSCGTLQSTVRIFWFGLFGGMAVAVLVGISTSFNSSDKYTSGSSSFGAFVSVGMADSPPQLFETNNLAETSGLATNSVDGEVAQKAENGSEASLAPQIGKPEADALPTNVWFSPCLREFIKLVKGGIDEQILLSYIKHAPGTFNLQADHIIYLRDIGVSAELIEAMLEHDRNFGVNTGQVATALAQSGGSESETEAGTEDTTTVTNVVYVTNVVEVRHFYEALAPYGTWVFVDDLGWCWRPSIVVVRRDWRPYCHDGWWVYTSFGWYWHSVYSWGSITFHYGRWFHHPVWGWCWWPDTVWAPAWVIWHVDHHYCGWAPLPPRARFHRGRGLIFDGRPIHGGHDLGLRPHHYTFVKWEDITHRDLHKRALPDSERELVFRRGKPVVDYDENPHGFVVHRGVHEEFTRRFGQPKPHELVIERSRDGKVEVVKARFEEPRPRPGLHLGGYRSGVVTTGGSGSRERTDSMDAQVNSQLSDARKPTIIRLREQAGARRGSERSELPLAERNDQKVGDEGRSGPLPPSTLLRVQGRGTTMGQDGRVGSVNQSAADMTEGEEAERSQRPGVSPVSGNPGRGGSTRPDLRGGIGRTVSPQAPEQNLKNEVGDNKARPGFVTRPGPSGGDSDRVGGGPSNRDSKPAPVPVAVPTPQAKPQLGPPPSAPAPAQSATRAAAPPERPMVNSEPQSKPTVERSDSRPTHMRLTSPVPANPARPAPGVPISQIMRQSQNERGGKK